MEVNFIFRSAVHSSFGAHEFVPNSSGTLPGARGETARGVNGFDVFGMPVTVSGFGRREELHRPPADAAHPGGFEFQSDVKAWKQAAQIGAGSAGGLFGQCQKSCREGRCVKARMNADGENAVGHSGVQSGPKRKGQRAVSDGACG